MLLLSSISRRFICGTQAAWKRNLNAFDTNAGRINRLGIPTIQAVRWYSTTIPSKDVAVKSKANERMTKTFIQASMKPKIEAMIALMAKRDELKLSIANLSNPEDITRETAKLRTACNEIDKLSLEIYTLQWQLYADV